MTISGGNSCTDRTGIYNSSIEYTLMDTTNAISGNGVISSFCFYSDSGNSYFVKPKIFRLNGSNYEIVYSAPSWIAASGSGLTTLTGYNISVQAGDLIGIGLQPGTGNATVDQETGGTRLSHAGDVTTTTTIASWSSASYTLSIGCSGTASGNDYYVIASGGSDSNGGQSWADAWATVNKGMSDTPTGKTLHIGFGTYASEPSDNKVFPANAITVIYETATTGGGSGTASVEINS